jgi:hypothetical protein
MRSKNEVLCAAAKAKELKPFLLRITYTIFSSNLHNKLFKTLLLLLLLLLLLFI